MSDPTVLVLFGATGDLVAKKIIPALFNLFTKDKLPKAFRIVAFGRRELTSEDFRATVEDILMRRLKDSFDRDALTSFVKMFDYLRGQFDSNADFERLAGELNEKNRFFYLAVPPELTPTIFENLAASGLSKEEPGGWTRVIVEKPIGDSGDAAERIEGVLCKTFKEPQIYRIDHYLAKEMVQNILTFRFSNSLFEQSWNGHCIESIDIKLWETLGVETRGAFYDGLGALRDVGQNHLLQMLAFVTMDHPQNFDAASIRNNRARILENLHLPTEEEIRNATARAQYEGYRSIQGVAPDSGTETYFKIATRVETPRWKDVAVMLESGKRMGPPRKEIRVTFRRPEACLCADDNDEHQKNIITFALEPDEGIMIEFWIKKPGLEFVVEKRTLDFLLRENGQRQQYVEEYEKLLLDCLTGDQTLFVDHDEVRAMWRFIDPIVLAWKKGSVPLKTYAPDTVPSLV